jgi:hypothetical protein
MSLWMLRVAQVPLDPVAPFVQPVLDRLAPRRTRDERGGGVCTFRLRGGVVFSVDLNENEVYVGAPAAPDCEVVLAAASFGALWRGAANTARQTRIEDGDNVDDVEVYGDPDVLTNLARVLHADP